MSDTDNTRPIAVIERDMRGALRVGKRSTVEPVLVHGGVKSAFVPAKHLRKKATVGRRQRDRITIHRALLCGDVHEIDFPPIPSDRRHIGYP